MKVFNRFNKVELEFISEFDEDFHKAMKAVMEKVNGPAIDDPKFEVLSTRIDKLEKELYKLEEFVNNKVGGY